MATGKSCQKAALFLAQAGYEALVGIAIFSCLRRKMLTMNPRIEISCCVPYRNGRSKPCIFKQNPWTREQLQVFVNDPSWGNCRTILGHFLWEAFQPLIRRWTQCWIWDEIAWGADRVEKKPQLSSDKVIKIWQAKAVSGSRMKLMEVDRAL